MGRHNRFLTLLLIGLPLISVGQSNKLKESSLGFFIGANYASFNSDIKDDADVSAIAFIRDRSGLQFGSFYVQDVMKNIRMQYTLGMTMQYHVVQYTPEPLVPVGDAEYWSANLYAEAAPQIFLGNKEEGQGARPYVSPALMGRYDLNYEAGFFNPISLAASLAIGLQSSTGVSDDKKLHVAPELKIDRDLSNRYRNSGVGVFSSTVYVSIKFY